MVSCAIRSCTSRSNVVKKSSGITYHRFPKDPVLRNAWIQFVNRGAWQPTKYSVLCSNHFAECYVDRTSQGNVRLRDNAVPSTNTTQNTEEQDDYNLVNDVLMEHNYTNISVIKIEPKIDVGEDNNIPLNTYSMTCSTPNEAKLKNENDIEVWKTDEQEIYIKQEVEAQDDRKNQTLPKKRGLWSENSLKEALVSIQNGMSVLKASEVYAIPRRTLRDHIKLGSSIKRLGRCSALNSDDTTDATAFSMTCSAPDEAKVKNENDIEAWKTDEQAFSECDIKNEEIYIKQEEVEAHDNSLTCSDPGETRIKIENDIEVWKTDELTYSECDVKNEEIDIKHEEVEAHDNRNNQMPPKKRGLWSENSLKEALISVQNGMSVLKASGVYAIPRRTLREHIKLGSSIKRLGRRSLLNSEQESELCRRIVRLSEIGMPLTDKVIRRSVYSFAESVGIKHNFNQTKKMAGRKWMALFLKRHPQMSRIKAQMLNPAGAQK